MTSASEAFSPVKTMPPGCARPASCAPCRSNSASTSWRSLSLTCVTHQVSATLSPPSRRATVKLLPAGTPVSASASKASAVKRSCSLTPCRRFAETSTMAVTAAVDSTHTFRARDFTSPSAASVKDPASTAPGGAAARPNATKRPRASKSPRATKPGVMSSRVRVMGQ